MADPERGLEREAGARVQVPAARRAAAPHVARALQLQRGAGNRATARALGSHARLQRVVFADMDAMWRVVHPGFDIENVEDSGLKTLYADAAKQLPVTDFVYQKGAAPAASTTAAGPQPYRVTWSKAEDIKWDGDRFAGAIIHELVHVATRDYRRNFIPGADVGDLVWANVNLPVAVGAADPQSGLAANQLQSLGRQIATLRQNWVDLEAEANADRQARVLRSNYTDVKAAIDVPENTGNFSPLLQLMKNRGLKKTVTCREAQLVKASLQNPKPRFKANWKGLREQAERDHLSGLITDDYAFIVSRFRYVDGTGVQVHNETVLGDIIYYLKAKGLDGSRTYKFASRMLAEANSRRRAPMMPWSDDKAQAQRVDRGAAWYDVTKW